jgi:hypothetical protein
LHAVAFSADGKTLATGSWLTVRLWEVATGKECGRFDNQDGDVLSLTFSPNGQVLAAGNSGTSALLWDLTGRSPDGRLSTANLSTQELQSLWNDLATQDAAKAYHAIWTLVAGFGQSVSFLKSHLRPVALIEPQQHKRLLQFITALDSDDFSEREKANQELEKLGETAEPELRKTLAEHPTPEMRGRLEHLLDKLQTSGLSQERLRASRAIEVLEQIGTPEARQVLMVLSQGAPHAEITEDARGARDRLNNK